MPGSKPWFALALLLAAGCSSGHRGSVTITPSDPHKLYAQSFDQAYISLAAAGEYDIVLVQDTIDHSRPLPTTSRPLQPIQQSDFRQIVHIHVFWQAGGGSVSRDGMVTNATIAWYVMAAGTEKEPEMLRYEGAGYVMLDPGKSGTTIHIRDGLMRQTDVRGPLHDPLGPSSLKGRVVALQNTAVVKDLLADLKSRVNSPSSAVTDVR